MHSTMNINNHKNSSHFSTTL